MRLGDRVGAAAIRERLDHLAVGDHQDDQQQHDRERDRQGVVQRCHAGRGQHDEDGLRTVRHRGQRVQGQRGQALQGGQLVLFLVRLLPGQEAGAATSVSGPAVMTANTNMPPTAPYDDSAGKG